MYCKNCGKEVKAEHEYCSECGTLIPIDHEIKKRSSYLWKIGVGVAIIAVVLVLIALDSPDSANVYKEGVSIDVLYELEPNIQPLGYFDKPEVYESEDMDIEEWSSHFQYYNDTEYPYENVRNTGTSFRNQGEVLRSVVKIMCFDSNESISFGSGLNDYAEGYILTNLHVVSDTGDVGCIVGFPNPDSGQIVEAYWATPIVDDDGVNMHDLAYLSVEQPVVDEEYEVYGYISKVTDGSFPYFKQPDSCYNFSLNLGDKIFVVGYPYQSGYALTITDGLISSLYSTSGYLVTSAKIVRGNSGGLAINENGCYVGVPTAVYGGGEDDFLGEIIDGEFVDEFYIAIEDELEEYMDSL